MPLFSHLKQNRITTSFQPSFQIVITRHGKPVGVLIGFETEDDWFDYKLENDPRFLRRIAQSRQGLKAGKGIPWEEIKSGEV